MLKSLTRLSLVAVIPAALASCALEDEAVTGSDRYHVESTPTELVAEGVIDRDEEHLFVFEPPAGATIMSVRLQGDGDADLSTQLAEEPTLESFACRPYVDGTDEECEHFDGRALYVKVRGWAPVSSYRLAIKVEGISTSP
ncbi:MAG TPA: hypothetical protein VML75_17325 [Kofleriaceae bacterium]|nr:hypothetical protein [Kofleriaceae bacterium]